MSLSSDEIAAMATKSLPKMQERIRTAMSEMSDKTDKTAQKVLDWNKGELLSYTSLDSFAVVPAHLPLPDLQKHAKFWLLRENVRSLIQSVDDEDVRSADYDRASWLLDKIKELDG